MNAETRRIYKDTPLACLPPCEQRNAMEGVARGHLASVGVATDVLVHATTMSWDETRKRFYLKFDNVCVDGHRAVYIVWQTPRGIHIFQHDGKAGISGGRGASMKSNKKFVFCAPGGKDGYSDPVQAEEYLMKNLAWCELPYLCFFQFGEGDAERVQQKLRERRRNPDGIRM